MTAHKKRASGVYCRNVSHSFAGTSRLFVDLNLAITPGEVVGIVGPSGSGKSTLLSIIAGWESPVSGSVERDGIERVGWVFQNPHGVARRTALDHVVLPLLARGYARRAAVESAVEIMHRFNLVSAAERRFSALSGGEAQRLMLARAVASGPDLLLVDEPTAQLDWATAATVNRVLGAVGSEDTIVIVATHDPQTQLACSRVVDLTDFQTPRGIDERAPRQS